MDIQCFNIGDQVKHKIYGDGSVINTAATSGGTQYFVKFGRAGLWLYGDNLKLVRRAMVGKPAPKETR